MALLHGLLGLARDGAWPLRLHVAHLNHGIRGAEADADEEFVRRQAAGLSLPCTYERVDVPAEAARSGRSVEETARDCRYRFFERVCLQTDSRVVAVGHHADDNAETIVQRLFRGTGLHGLAGIRPSRRLSPNGDVRLVRPMLSMRRARIREFLEANGIAYRHDSTNDAVHATRNRIRHEILPLIERCINAQGVEALLRLADQAAGLDEYLRETAEKILETVVVDHDAGELILDAALLTRRRRILQTEVIRQALCRVGCTEGELNARHLTSVADLAADVGSGRSIDLPGGVSVAKSYTKLIIARADSTAAAAVVEVALGVPGRAHLPEQRLEIEASIEPAVEGVASRLKEIRPDGEEWLDWDAVTPPLAVRGRRCGDRFRPLGMPAEKKVAEFLLDEKVPQSQRERTAVLCDQKGPLWVIPFRIDHRARITENTRRILRLRLSRF